MRKSKVYLKKNDLCPKHQSVIIAVSNIEQLKSKENNAYLSHYTLHKMIHQSYMDGIK